MTRSLKLLKMNPAEQPPKVEQAEEITPLEFFLSHSPSEQLRLMEWFDQVVEKSEPGVHTLDLGNIRCTAA